MSERLNAVKRAGQELALPDLSDGDEVVIIGESLDDDDWMVLRSIKAKFRLELRNGQKRIPEGAMREANIVELYAPDMLQVQSRSFYGCPHLRFADLPSVRALGEQAFDGCNEMLGLSCPDLAYYSRSPFANLKKMLAIRLGSARPKPIDRRWHGLWLSRRIGVIAAPNTDAYDKDNYIDGLFCYVASIPSKAFALPEAERFYISEHENEVVTIQMGTHLLTTLANAFDRALDRCSETFARIEGQTFDPEDDPASWEHPLTATLCWIISRLSERHPRPHPVSARRSITILRSRSRTISRSRSA